MFCRVKNCCSGDDAKNYTGAEMVNELLTPLQAGGKEAVEAGTLPNRHGRQAAHQARGRYELGLLGKIIGNDGGKPKILMGPQEIEHLPLPFEGGQVNRCNKPASRPALPGVPHGRAFSAAGSQVPPSCWGDFK